MTGFTESLNCLLRAVRNRAQARQEAVQKPLRVTDTVKLTGVDRAELIRLQQEDYTIRKMGEAMTPTVCAPSMMADDRWSA